MILTRPLNFTEFVLTNGNLKQTLVSVFTLV